MEYHSSANVREYKNLLILSWFFVIFPLASSAVRFHLFLAPLIAMLAGERLAKFFQSCWCEEKVHPFRMFLLLFLALLSWELLVCGTDLLTFSLSLFHLSFGIPSFSVPVQILITLSITALLVGVVLQNFLYSESRKVLRKDKFHLALFLLILGIGLAGTHGTGLAQRAWIVSNALAPYPDAPTRHAIEWMKDNLPQNSVVAARWDIGSPINELGRRSTLVDEEQEISRIQEISADVFCGTEEQTLHFLKKYGATHLLLTSEDISMQVISAKVSAEVFHNRSVSFPILLKRAQEYSSGEMRFLGPKGIRIRNKDLNFEKSGEIAYFLKSLSVPYRWEGEFPIIQQPARAIISDGNSQLTVAIKEIIINEKEWYFPDAQMDGTVWIRGEVIQSGAERIFHIPYAFYLTSKARSLLPVKLFLGEEIRFFKLMYEAPQVQIWEIEGPKEFQAQKLP